MTKHKQEATGGTAGTQPAQLDELSLTTLTAKIERNLGKIATEHFPNSKKKRKYTPESPAASPRQKKKQTQDRQRSREVVGRPITNTKNNNAGTLSRDALLEEIRALGGNENDLQLIEDIDSDQEAVATSCGAEEDGPAVDGALRNELAAFAAQLGLQQYHEKDYMEDSEQEPSRGDEKEEAIGGSSSVRTLGGFLEPSTLGVSLTETKASVKKQFKFEPRPDWHGASLAGLPEPATPELNDYAGATNSLKLYAQDLLDADAMAYSKSVLASSSRKFLSTIMSSGTLSDKVSALTLAIQESPLHNVKAFESLLGLASKRSRAQAIGALGALVDLLGPGLVLPPNRRLRTFQSQLGLLGALQEANVRSWSPGQPLPSRMTDAHLIQWAYEDWLKVSYFKVIQLLEVWCNDEIEYSRTRSLDFVYGLLKDKPEQETNLLRLLVNKLGDKDRKISSRVSYLLLQLQNSHPGMKQIIIRGIEQEVLLRPGQTFRAKYHATNTLNQTILSSREVATAEALLSIYFAIFVTLLNSSVLGRVPAEDASERPASVAKESSVSAERQTADKLVTAVLTGINRAVPFVSANNPVLESQVDTLFRIAHSTNFNTSIQSLILIQQLSVSRHLASDRFYRTLYESLLDPRLYTSSKQALYLNLLLRSLKADVDTRRIKAFAKRMLQVLNLHQPAFTCGLLYVVFQLRLQCPELRALFEEPEDVDASDLEPSGSEVIVKGMTYDGRKRNPEHSNAQNSCLWEIVPPLTHYHPSVALLAAGAFSHEEQMTKPDLESHSLIRFLDKFVYRNPKAADTNRGVSIMQPLRKPDSGSIWLTKGTDSAGTGPLNSPSFWNKKAEQVAAEDIFFHEYFKQAGKKAEVVKQGSAPMSGSPDYEDDPAQEDEIWKALTASHPDGPIDSDESDLDMGGFDEGDSDGSSEAGVVFSEGPEMELSAGDDGDGAEELEAGDEGTAELSPVHRDGKEGSEKNQREARSSRRRIKDLPMFASAEDYAELLAQEEDS
ncbi:Ribosome biogenesis protein NOC1 [Colletotrichum sidae]|uniref:Ribosome biogenesis protein NOC1 n=1 Tax=Colletotrichum sidae TaxID=1347389 RepID=A0A4R8T1C1_9PEZI|nr:Ribosome biogenesis protein NOC1 [Colletotrichum sidae]